MVVVVFGAMPRTNGSVTAVGSVLIDSPNVALDVLIPIGRLVVTPLSSRSPAIPCGVISSSPSPCGTVRNVPMLSVTLFTVTVTI